MSDSPTNEAAWGNCRATGFDATADIFSSAMACVSFIPSRAIKKCYKRHFMSSARSAKVFDSAGNPLPQIRAKFDDVGKELNIKRMEDWYETSTEEFIECEGTTLLRKHFNGSLAGALQRVYPEHDWNVFKFKNKQKRAFADLASHRAYFDWLGEELGVRIREDWYALLPTTLKLRKLGGSALIKKYTSPILALQAAYPEHRFQVWKFDRVPVKSWKDPTFLRHFFDSLAPEVGVKKLEDWYGAADRHVLLNAGGFTALSEHKNIAAVFNKAYPEHHFVEWKFAAVPSGFWEDLSNRRRALLWIAREKGLITGTSIDENSKIEESELEKLYQLKLTDLFEHGVSRLQKYSDMHELLVETFPEHDWTKLKFPNLRSK